MEQLTSVHSRQAFILGKGFWRIPRAGVISVVFSKGIRQVRGNKWSQPESCTPGIGRTVYVMVKEVSTSVTGPLMSVNFGTVWRTTGDMIGETVA
jgi:hypothetical protein